MSDAIHDAQVEARLVARLRAAGCHTVLLSGSRARGDATPESDWDLCGIRPTGETARDAGLWEGMWLDAWLLSESTVAAGGEPLAFLAGARVLHDPQGWGQRLITAARQAASLPPVPLPAAEQVLRRAWMHKTLIRAARGDPEGDFRRAWLLSDSLETFFALRGLRYPGPKGALQQLARERPASHQLAVAALHPGAPHTALEAWVHEVAGPLAGSATLPPPAVPTVEQEP